MAARSNAIRHYAIRHGAHRTNCTTAYISEIAMTEAPAGIPSSVKVSRYTQDRRMDGGAKQRDPSLRDPSRRTPDELHNRVHIRNRHDGSPYGDSIPHISLHDAIHYWHTTSIIPDHPSRWDISRCVHPGERWNTASLSPGKPNHE